MNLAAKNGVRIRRRTNFNNIQRSFSFDFVHSFWEFTNTRKYSGMLTFFQIWKHLSWHGQTHLHIIDFQFLKILLKGLYQLWVKIQAKNHMYISPLRYYYYLLNRTVYSGVHTIIEHSHYLFWISTHFIMRHFWCSIVCLSFFSFLL